MIEKVYAGFYSVNGQVSCCGFPESEKTYKSTDGKTITYVVFTGRVAFYYHDENYYRILMDDMASRFLEADLKEYKYWYPVSMGTMYLDTSNGVKVEYAEMSNGLVIYGVFGSLDDCHAIIVPSGINKYYEKNY